MNCTYVHQKTNKTIKLFRVGVTPWLVEERFLGPNSICIIICVSTQHTYQARGKKLFFKVHGTQKLADVSTGLAVLDVDTRWTSRAVGGQGVPCPRVLGVVALVSVSVTK